MGTTPELHLIQLPFMSIIDVRHKPESGDSHTMTDTRLKPRPARSRLAAVRVFGEYLHDQRAKRPDENRWAFVDLEYESTTRSGDCRTLLPT